jgi:hypothetical protein
MAYSIDLRAAADRHLQAADALVKNEPDRNAQHRSVSGYLYGIAAECAVKALMCQAGMRPLDSSKRKDDSLFAHFPELRTMLRDLPAGRLSGPILHFIFDNAFMDHWNTRMRYAPGSDVQADWVAKWREQARQVVACIDT